MQTVRVLASCVFAPLSADALPADRGKAAASAGRLRKIATRHRRDPCKASFAWHRRCTNLPVGNSLGHSLPSDSRASPTATMGVFSQRLSYLAFLFKSGAHERHLCIREHYRCRMWKLLERNVSVPFKFTAEAECAKVELEMAAARCPAVLWC